MSALWALPFFLQAIAMAVDEFVFHRKRPLTRWEKFGHPVDTLVFLLCLAIPLVLPLTTEFLVLYALVAVASCALITKDEFVHARQCSPTEHWLHSVLFLLHPLVLVATAFLWSFLEPPFLGYPRFEAWVPAPEAARVILMVQCFATVGFLFHQIASWRRRAPEQQPGQ